jgi:hypothetical protein
MSDFCSCPMPVRRARACGRQAREARDRSPRLWTKSGWRCCVCMHLEECCRGAGEAKS